MGTLAYVLNEEHRTFCRNIVGRAAQSVEHGYVAAPEDARTLAFVIELMCRAGIAERGFFLQFIAEQDVFQGLGTKVVFRLHGEMPRHGSVQRSEAVLLEHIVQGGDITETDKPFGMSAELGKVKLSHQMHSAVSAATAKDNFGFLVVHGFLQVFQALLYASCVSAVRAACMFGDDHVQSPRLQPLFGSFQEGLVNLAGRGENNHPVALVHVWRKNKAVHIVYLSVFVTKVHNSPQRAQRFTEFFYFFRGVAVNHGLFRLVT